MGAAILVLSALLLTVWLTVRDTQRSAAAAVAACRYQASRDVELVAATDGYTTSVGDVFRRADTYVVEVETWVLEDGRQVDDDRHRLVECTASEEDGQWLGELES